MNHLSHRNEIFFEFSYHDLFVLAKKLEIFTFHYNISVGIEQGQIQILEDYSSAVMRYMILRLVNLTSPSL